MINILFVCLGNICRSPAAEAVFKKVIDEKKLDDRFRCESAGILDYHQGKPCDPRMDQALNQRGYMSSSLSRPVVVNDFEHFDYIVAMDHSNLRDLKNLEPDSSKAKIHLLSDFSINHRQEEVPDPYYGGMEGFNLVIDMVEDAINGIINRVKA